MAFGPEAGLRLVEVLDATGELNGYHLLHAARADMQRRLGNHAEAAASYARALESATNEGERRFLEKRLKEACGKAG